MASGRPGALRLRGRAFPISVGLAVAVSVCRALDLALALPLTESHVPSP